MTGTLTRMIRSQVTHDVAIERGIAAAQIGNFVMSLDILQEVYEDPSTNVSLRGLSYYALSLAVVQKRFRRAIDLCRRSIEIQPDGPDHYLNLMKIFQAVGSKRQALAAIEQGLRILPDEPLLIQARARLGIRSRPPVPFLRRGHPVNKAWGRFRYLQRKGSERRSLRRLQELGLLPPNRYFDSLSLPLGASREKVEQKYQELQGRFSTDPAFGERLQEITRAYNVLVSFHKRQIEAAPPQPAKRIDVRPAAICRAYEQFGLSASTPYETVVAVYHGIIRQLQQEQPAGKLDPYARAFHLIRRYVEAQDDQAVVEIRPAETDSTFDSTVTRDPLRHYLKLLGLPPNATFDQVKTAFAARSEGFSTPITPDEEERQERIRRAYSIIIRVFDERSQTTTVERKRWLAKAGGVVLAILLTLLIASNLGTLRDLTAQYEPGDLLYRVDNHVLFGTVVAFDPAHQFAAGRPVAAYQVQLSRSSRKIWISRRAVVGGMKAVRAKDPPS